MEAGTSVMDTSKVTRFEVVDHRSDGVLYLPGSGPMRGVRGRVLTAGEKYTLSASDPPLSVELMLQDGGRTLKVFLGDGEED